MKKRIKRLMITMVMVLCTILVCNCGKKNDGESGIPAETESVQESIAEPAENQEGKTIENSSESSPVDTESENQKESTEESEEASETEVIDEVIVELDEGESAGGL